MDTPVGVQSGLILWQRPDGTRYQANVFVSDAPVIECATARFGCEGFAPLPAATTSEQAYQAAIALLDQAAAGLTATIGPLGDAAVSTLSQAKIEQLSPTLGALTSPETKAYELTGLGLPELIARTGLGPTIQAELASSTQQLFESGYLNQVNPDPGSPSVINQLQRYALAIGETIERAPEVAAYRESAMGLLDDLGLSGFSSSGSLGSVFNSLAIPTFNPTSIDAGSPPITTTSGGVLSGLGTIGQVLDAASGPIVGILQLLAQRGVIRGTVGDLLAPQVVNVQSMQSPSAGVSAGNVAAMNLAAGGGNVGLLEQLALALGASQTNSIGDGSMTGNMLAGLENLLGVNQGGCGSSTLRVPMAGAMALYKQGCGKQYIPRRILVDGPDGVPVVLYNAGKATIGSRETSVARSIARRQGFKLSRYGSGGGRRRRRSPR